MTLKKVSTGRRAGDLFWGCTKFPSCRGSRDVFASIEEAGGAGSRTARTARRKAGAQSATLRPGGLFVSSANSHGPGKLVREDGEELVLEYFDTPGQPLAERRRETVPRASVQPFRFSHEQRVFWRSGTQWRSGRVLDVSDQRDIYVRAREWEGHLPELDLYVRWDNPLSDPIGFGGAGLMESPLLADMRRPFLQSTLAQRSAAHGMRGLLSSRIELHKHQVETAWRVLRDPIQRYLLADEVGLGKTIEAGLVIRELLMDKPDLIVQFVLPPFLVEQWRRELTEKFCVKEFPDARLVFSRDDRPDSWEAADLLVVDEAHNLAGLVSHARSELAARYDRLSAVAASSPRLLLLSATPALHNEQTFLSMLKLLDPVLYRRTTPEELRQRLESRAKLGRLFLGLQPKLPGALLKNRLAELATNFPTDTQVSALIDTAVRAIGEQDREAVTRAIGSVRTYVSEVYRVHRRMLRTRRTEALQKSYQVTGRTSPKPLVLDAPELFDLPARLDEWRQEALAARETDPAALRQAASDFADAVSLSLDPDSLKKWARARTGATEGEQEALDRLANDLDLVDSSRHVARRVANDLSYLYSSNERAVVFCPTSRMAEIVADALKDFDAGEVYRHVATDPAAASDQAVLAFEHSRSAALLVADSSAEEGRNLQFAELMVHVGMPARANRLEQRIGRCDRWGAHRDGVHRRSRWVAEADGSQSFAAGWMRVLDEGFGIFDRSVASLQHAVDVATETAWLLLFEQGLDAVPEAIDLVRGLLEEEVERVREQDALDSIEAPSDELSVYSRMAASEGEAAAFADLTHGLLATRPGSLRFTPEGDPVHRVGGYRAGGDSFQKHSFTPLVPASRLQRDFVPLEGHHGTFVREAAVVNDGVRLYRYGDRFIDSVSDFLWHDDRGRAFGMWRWRPDWSHAERVAYRFDYAVEARPLQADAQMDPVDRMTMAWLEQVIKDPAALQRRADGLFPPLIATIWVDVQGAQVTDPEHLSVLQERYAKPDSPNASGDYALNADRIEHAYELVSMDVWEERWRAADRAAQELVLGGGAVVEACERAVAVAEADVATRLAQLNLRAVHADGAERATLEEEVERESVAGEELLSALRKPSLRLDSTGVVVVSGRSLDQDGWS
ncbi:protein DpdE [Kitasatospora sp. NPDC058115]|uniref:protein DpdE n=1 Tax=Kitasatospora sp. NPDC058115 TaxID=3346347 RepID=UPI0036DDBEBA